MKSKITAGLWRAYLRSTIFTGQRWHVVSENSKTTFVARICAIDGSPDETVANARAIEALPELLEALRTIQALAGKGGNQQIALIAEVAIKRALGI